MKKIEKPEWLRENAELCKDGFGPFIAQLIDNQNELVAWHDAEMILRKAEEAVEDAKHTSKPITEPDIEQPGHWKCEDCKHIYFNAGTNERSSAFLPRENDGNEYNCIFCDPGGGTVKWIPDNESEETPEKDDMPEHNPVATLLKAAIKSAKDLTKEEYIDLYDEAMADLAEADEPGPWIAYYCPACGKAMRCVEIGALSRLFAMRCKAECFQGPARATPEEATDAWLKAMWRGCG